MLNFKQNKNLRRARNNTKKAFTLIEALVAISILMIAIACPMSLAQKGLSTATLSKDQMVATFLAQDAIEAVKNIRDQIAIRGGSGDWLSGTILSNCVCVDGNNCNFDSPSPSTLKFCIIDTTRTWTNDVGGSIQAGSQTNPGILKIFYDSTSNFVKYDYTGANGGVNSKFTRFINIKKTSDSGTGADEAVVNVRVFWDSPLGVQKIDIQNFIYNYSENFPSF